MAEDIKVVIEAVLNSEQFKKAAKQMENDGKKSAEGIQGGLKKLRLAYVAVAGVITGTVIKTIGKFIKAAGEQEKAEKSLAQAMKQAGTFTEAAYKHNLNYAKSLQKVTAFGDEAILGVQRSLTVYGVEGKMLERLTKVTLDLAAAKGMDLKTAGELVAKSVGSSTNALGRYGVEITGAVGSTERMTSAVDNLTKLFGGQAEAQAQTFSGRVQQMKNALGDFYEVIGNKIIPVLTPLVGYFTKLLGGTDSLESSTSGLVGAYEEWQKTIKITKENIDGLSKEQHNLNMLQEANAKLKFFETLDNINKGYKDQIKEITKLEKKAKEYSAAVEDNWLNLKEAELAGKKDAKVKVEVGLIYKELANKTMSLAAAQKFSIQTNLEAMKAETAAAAKKEELEKSITNLAKAQMSITSINILDTIANEDLRNAVAARVAAIKNGTFVTKEAEVATEALTVATVEYAEVTSEIEKLITETQQVSEIQRIQQKIDALEEFKRLNKLKKDDNEIIETAITAFEKKQSDIRIKQKQDEARYTLSIASSVGDSLSRIGKASAKKGANLQKAGLIFQKGAALANIAIDTHQAISKGFAMFGPPPSPAGIGAAIAAGAQGTLSAAAIIAEAIPEFKGFAMGGRPPTDRPSIVGERGIETFMPDTPGTVFSNAVTRGLMFGQTGVSSAQESVVTNNDNTTKTYNFYGIRDIAAARNELLRTEGAGAF
jgi:hypothetical protein